MPAFAQVLDFLYPPKCAACGTPLATEPGRRVCARCVARVELVPNPRCEVCGGPLESTSNDATRCARCLAHPPRYRIARTVARYRTTAEDEPGTLPALIRRHKYGLDQSVGRALVEYLGDELPVSAARLRRRDSRAAALAPPMVAWIQPGRAAGRRSRAPARSPARYDRDVATALHAAADRATS